MNQDELNIACIRSTVIDVINKAKSGHPGMALGSAPILYTLFKNHLVSDPNHPEWINRDRFVLSAGHVSSLLYTMLHLCGYGLTINDLKKFRQINSLTPGHPEYKHTKGVDATSGPLGQGIAQAVGMAMAEQAVASLYEEGSRLCNHYTYVLCGDGCLQEGLSQEAISLAGHQKLNKLILMYDSNAVTLDGSLDLSFSENVKERFLASEWDVLEVKDGNDIKAIDKALRKAKKSKEKPTLIIVHTIIGFGSKNQGLSKTHGAPLGEEDGKNAKLSYGFDYPDFTIPESVYETFKETFIARGQQAYQEYQTELQNYKAEHLEDYKKFVSVEQNDVSLYISELPTFEKGFKDSTRNTSQAVLNVLHKDVFNLIGGSADVAKSVMTMIKDEKDFSPTCRSGRNINFGIREFAMASAQNGMLLHGGLRTYVGSFMIFSDYMKAAIRMSAISKLPAIYLLSHDSIAVGEDGPTHQPIEQLAALRSMPNVNVFRPCDAVETAAAWKLALLSSETPTCIALSRQGLPKLETTSYDGVLHGGYVVSKEKRGLELNGTIIATGSEVSLALKVQELLSEEGINVRGVSMPSTELFDEQKKSYQEKVFGVPYEKRISCEMLSSFGWHKYAKNVMGLDTFGASAPASDVIKKFNFTEKDLVKFVKKSLK